MSLGLGDRRGQCRLVGDIGFERQSGMAMRDQLVGNIGHPRGVTVYQRHLRALVGEALRRGFPDRASRAGDQNCTATEALHTLVSFGRAMSSCCSWPL
jgi:hypothetical protein